jgi:4-amino-4-deoxychorismate lyase
MPHDTPLLLETIRIEGGIIHNLPYHQARMDKSRAALFPGTSPIDLGVHLTIPDTHSCIRCRILYGKKIEKITYLPYTPKPIHHLKIVTSDIDYHYKYAHREPLNALLAAHPDADEVIIEKDGLLTDTTIANIAFYKEGKWYTPHSPLLEGTMRAKLLDEGILHPIPITKADIKACTHVALINAMIGFKILNTFTIE